MSRLTMMDSLPNEILDAVLDSLPTPSLLPMALVCRRFCAAVKETLRVRLLQTTDLDGLEMVLECYHPIAKLSTPMLSCRQGPLTTLGPATAAAPSPWDEGWGLGDVGRLYSRFVPEDAEAKQEVTLDEDELFSQLCTSAAIVKKGPRRGFYRSHSSVGDGVMRVWRDWLAASASTPAAKAETETTKGCEEDTILWADHGKTVGVRFGVTPSDHATPSTEAGEEPAVEYTLHYREVLVRTSRVLLAMERSAAQEGAQRGTGLYEVAGDRSFAVETVFWSAVSHAGYARAGVAAA